MKRPVDGRGGAAVGRYPGGRCAGSVGQRGARRSGELRAIGREDELAHSSIRFSIGATTTVEEIDYAIEIIREKVSHLRGLSPLWDMHKEGLDLTKVNWVHGTESHRSPETALV